MKKLWIILGVIALVVIIVLMSFTGMYNSLVSAQENVNGKWAIVQDSYQRRLDLIPNLVTTVQEAADFEQETLTQVTQLRSEAVSTSNQMGQAQNPQAVQALAQEGNSVLTRFFAIMENYPTITATQNFRDLQVQLEGTENRIKVARDNYNTAVQSYNAMIRRFPTNIIAGMFGFEREEFFEADPGADVVPEVNFE